MARVVAIVGKSSVGKSTVRQELAGRLQWTSVAIDEHRQLGGGWSSMLVKLDMAGWPMLVESIAFPPTYRRVLARHDARVLEVVCDERDRIARGGLAEDRSFVYNWPERMTVHTSQPVDFDGVVAWCRASRPGVKA